MTRVLCEYIFDNLALSDIGINLVIKKTFKFYKFISDIRFGTGNDNCTADRVSV